jgi:hypothetical protein
MLKNLTKHQKFLLYKFFHKKLLNITFKELEELEKLLTEENKIGEIITQLLKPLLI